MNVYYLAKLLVEWQIALVLIVASAICILAAWLAHRYHRATIEKRIAQNYLHSSEIPRWVGSDCSACSGEAAEYVRRDKVQRVVCRHCAELGR